jgi:dTDP-4-dehydrorhamnose reductase
LKYQYRNVDLGDYDGLRKVALTSGAEAIVHCGAMTDVDACEKRPLDAWRVNFESTAILAEVATLLQARFLYVSTESVFSGKDGPNHEADVPDPINIYSRAKLAGEFVVKDLCRVNYVIARIGAVYGGRVGGKPTFADRVVDSLSHREPISAFLDQRCSPTLASACGDRLMAILESDWVGPIHASDQGTYTRLEFARVIADIYGFDKGLIRPAFMHEMNLPALRPAMGGLRTDVCHDYFPNNRPLFIRDAVTQYKLEKEQA